MRRASVPRTVVTVATVVAAALTGCGVQTDRTPHDVPEANRARLTGVSSGSDASGAERIYLVEPGEDKLLRSVPRNAASAEELMKTLLLGPNPEELNAQFASAIPSTLRLLSARLQGPFVYLDVSEELTELSGPALVQALAQIVYTASELEGVQSVQISVLGERLAWPRGDFESTTEPLNVYDYPGLVRSAQPAYPSVPSGATGS